MNEDDLSRPTELRMDPEDLDGHTIEELSRYLDSGCSPPDPQIERSPGCRIALDAMMRLRSLTADLIVADTEAESAPDESWVQGILANIAVDARAGRRIPIVVSGSSADLGITEGAARGVIRGAERAVPGILIGRCQIAGDVTVPGETVTVSVDASVLYGHPIADLVARLRDEISSRLGVHTTLNVAGIDINVHDIHELPTVGEGN